MAQSKGTGCVRRQGILHLGVGLLYRRGGAMYLPKMLICRFFISQADVLIFQTVGALFNSLLNANG